MNTHQHTRSRKIIEHNNAAQKMKNANKLRKECLAAICFYSSQNIQREISNYEFEAAVFSELLKYTKALSKRAGAQLQMLQSM